MDDLVKRLRRMDGDSMSIKTLDEAADRIEALERQVKAADALADAHLDIVETTEGLTGIVIQECRQISRKALAAYRATKKGGA